jgi:cytochrome d ubiquinol oxidase subunit I
MVVTERRYYKSGLDVDRSATKFWLRLFTATFAIGVATGITMEFAFGTNWASFSRFVGDVFGAPLAAEGIFSFFLESTFLGVLLFGRNRVSKRFYYVSTWLVAIGAHLSALWIIIANSWMQTPRGYEVVGGRAVLTNFWQAALNPSTLPRYLHTVVAAWVVGAFVVAGIAAYYLLKKRHVEFAKRAMKGALVLGLVASLAMPFIGHFHALEVAKEQPAKMAAFEGLFQTQKNAPLTLFGIVDPDGKTVHARIAVPNLLSLMLGFSPNFVVTGLDQIPANEQPPLQWTFQTYHFMVLLGLYFVALMVVGLVLLWRKKLDTTRWYLRALAVSIPLPIIAMQLGWMAAEIGRQPWVVQGVLRTRDAISSTVPAGQILTSLIIFGLIYALLFAGWLRVVLGAIRTGPEMTAGSEAVPAAAATSTGAPAAAE